MTIIEFFEKSPLENMISCLTSKPDKVIFLGDKTQIDETLPIYKRFLANKNIQTRLISRHIDKHDLKDIVKKLTEIIQTEKACVFDITGGDDLVLLGCGIVFATYRSQYPIKLQRFDLEKGKIIDCDCDDEVSFKGVFSVSVEELISLYGGVVLPEKPQPPIDAKKQDVDVLWDMACNKLKIWNSSVKYLNEFEKRSYDKMNVNLSLPSLKNDIFDYTQKLSSYSFFLRELSKKGIISNLRINNENISYRYKNPLARRCLNSPGNILEMKVLFEARNLQENEKPFFDSCYIGVNIDWDGIIHNSNETKNEIDVILMRALTPIFISCKIGEVNEIETYKLWTVAERFGGKFVKKVLIAGDFEMKSQKAEIAFCNRAKDMGITFITHAAKMTKQDWETTLKSLVE